MADLIEYIDWRGDLSLIASPFNEVDALILCQLSYLDYNEIISSEFSENITIENLFNCLKNSSNFNQRSQAGFFINPDTVKLLNACAASNRFKNIKVSGFVNKIDLSIEEQFSALTFILEDKSAVVAFRGTDDTIVGWKEDFNMSFLDVIPSQKDSVSYLQNLCAQRKFPFFQFDRIKIVGHSKGGNLAMYAASFSSKKVKDLICDVFSFDAPGLNEKLFSRQEFEDIKPILHSFYPQFSIIGMLFNHPESYTVVESSQSGIMQHDPFSWHVIRNHFFTLPDFVDAGKYIQKTINKWFFDLPLEKRELFVETLFNILKETKAKTNTELASNWLKNSATVLKALALLDSTSRKEMLEILSLLFKTATIEMPEILK